MSFVGVIGKGTYGEVSLYERKIEVTEPYVVKTIKNKYVTIETIAELDALRRIRHPNIISAEKLEIDFDHTLITMEYGPLLPYFLLQHGPLYNMKLIADLISGVVFLHENNMFHCDIKPTNIVVVRKFDCRINLKLIDLGLLSNAWADPYCPQTMSYAPPESVFHNFSMKTDPKLESLYKQEPDPKFSDYWAIGACIIYILTKKEAFWKSNHTDTNIIEDLEAYMKNPTDFLIELGITDVWIPVLLEIMNPIAINRSLNRIIQKLKEQEFDLIPGKIIKIDRNYQPIHSLLDDIIYKWNFISVDMALQGLMSEIDENHKTYHFYVGSLDLFFRYYPKVYLKDIDLPILVYACAAIMITALNLNISYKSFFGSDYVATIQKIRSEEIDIIKELDYFLIPWDVFSLADEMLKKELNVFSIESFVENYWDVLARE